MQPVAKSKQLLKGQHGYPRARDRRKNGGQGRRQQGSKGGRQGRRQQGRQQVRKIVEAASTKAR
eukprot:scaffold2474_cov142-Pinguiococcus_pyrenoidosus.AAC.2